MDVLASNKIFVGFAILIMNIGSRFVIMDVGKAHEKLLNHELVKKLVVFCMFFVATRDIMTAAILTFAFIILLEGLLNENSRFSILPAMFRQKTAPGPRTTLEDYTRAIATIERFIAESKQLAIAPQ
jgi:hypothetical protein